jgi:cell division septation protein DedD
MPQSFAVQVGALRSEQPAQEIAMQLRAKNYPAMVILPDSDAPIPWFRVQVGPYQDRAQAERVRQRLIDEEQFDAFITR